MVNNIEMVANVEEVGGGGGSSELESSSKSKFCIFGVISVVLIIFLAILIGDSVYTIDEGTVGIHYIQGRLDDRIAKPGIHWKTPFVTRLEIITIRPQTDNLRPIKTVTKDGISNTFNDIQVLSTVREDKLVLLIRKFGIKFRQTLIYDRIGEELRRICANQTIDEVYNTKFLQIVPKIIEKVKTSIARLGESGVNILNLVVPKPDIPLDISQNYQEVKVQWTKQLVATQEQKTEKLKKETESMKAIMDAERQKSVLEIDIQKDLLKKEGEKKISSLNNLMHKEREMADADVKAYAKEKQANANLKLYTQDYVKLEMAKQLSQNTKYYFSGNDGALGGLLSKIFN